MRAIPARAHRRYAQGGFVLATADSGWRRLETRSIMKSLQSGREPHAWLRSSHETFDPLRAAIAAPKPMKLKLLIAAVVIIAGLFFANRWLSAKKEYIANVPAAATPAGGTVREKFTVGFLPVTCHLTCPVTSWVTEHSDKGTQFEAQKFQDFPSMKEALIARQIDATFMITPLAMKLVADGVPVKIVYLGHRDGIATSGKWLDQDKDKGAQHRKDAAIVVGKMYYNQKPELLDFVLTKDVNRVKYTGLKPPKERFDEMMDLSVEFGVIPKHMKFEE